MKHPLFVRQCHSTNTVVTPQKLHAHQGTLTRTDKPLPVIVFTLATNSAEHTENVNRANCKVLYLQKQGTEPVANGAMVEVLTVKLMGCRFDP